MSWRDRPFMALDTETTGVDVETDRIVTACLALAGPNGWQPTNWLLKQGQPIPDEATAVHGIATEHANTHGVDPAEALAQIADSLTKGWALGMPLVVYNATYDLTILDRELRRHDLGPLEVGPVLDPFVIDKDADPYRKGSRKLIDVCAHYGITLDADEAHGAEADARAAARLAWKVAGRFVDLDFAQQEQAAMYRQQRESFAKYLAKQGKQLDDDNRVWPLKPWPGAEGVAA